MQKELEERIISLIKTPEDMSNLVFKGISPESFVIRRDIYGFLVEYNSKYGNIPTQQIVEANFPDFTYKVVPSEEFSYLADELVKSEKRRSAAKIIEKGVDIITADTYGGLDYLVTKLASLRGVHNISRSYTDRDALDRLKLMEERKDKITKGLQIGLKTGLSFFDDNMIGWLPGNLIAIIGRPGIGKSWLLMYLACFAYYFGGARVAYLSPEMAIPEVEDRWDTIKSAFEGEGFSNESLTSGKVNLPKYKKYLESTSKRNDWVTLDSNEGKAFSLASAQSIVDEFQPDLVCVDGLILMDSGNAGDGESWEAMRKLAYGLKNIAQNNKIVIMAASQAGRNAAGAMPELHQIYGGDALAQAADVAIMVSDVAEAGNEAEAFTRYITIPKRRSGKTFAKKMKLRFNVDRGSIGL